MNWISYVMCYNLLLWYIKHETATLFLSSTLRRCLLESPSGLVGRQHWWSANQINSYALPGVCKKDGWCSFLPLQLLGLPHSFWSSFIQEKQYVKAKGHPKFIPESHGSGRWAEYWGKATGSAAGKWDRCTMQGHSLGAPNFTSLLGNNW